MTNALLSLKKKKVCLIAAAAANTDTKKSDKQKEEEKSTCATDDDELPEPIDASRNTIGTGIVVINITHAISQVGNAVTMITAVLRTLFHAMILAGFHGDINHIFTEMVTDVKNGKVITSSRNNRESLIIIRIVYGSDTTRCSWAKPDSTVFIKKHTTTDKTNFNVGISKAVGGLDGDLCGFGSVPHEMSQKILFSNLDFKRSKCASSAQTKNRK